MTILPDWRHTRTSVLNWCKWLVCSRGSNRGLDNVLDRLDTAIKEYLTSIDTDALDDTDHRRLSEILAFTTNLEHAGDIVEKSLMSLAAKRIKRGVSFSEISRQEIREMMDRLIGNARAAAAVFMTEDPRAARQLLGEKEVFREIGNAHNRRILRTGAH